MAELKPCPFCGGEAAVFCERKSDYPYMMIPVLLSNVVSVAKKCGIYFRQNSVISRAEYRAPVINRDRYEEAVEAWNRRADNA